ncbi:BamA/TamA family outer membrane protein [Achromobacter sp. UMC46]|uniref:BamA/TamA family outer membrane protein n=1 Tax=Achromobacter sp. UMC46 TaxID=1862319 RepID=UPI00210783C3|nr:BamA/TamA family outer membrane protein [Achromobacter sp. UMC46]MBB1594561.1 glyceraldehyde-3-phosphate dehydrogenase [Achromobacter sp. UMC46]
MAAIAALGLAFNAVAADSSSFKDPEDGAFDISDFLLHRKGVMPVPAIITEPAVGYGGGLMLLYFSESLADAERKAQEERGTLAPPNVTGVGGALTENGSRFGGLFHFHTWGGDRYRYLGALAQGRMNLDYYGLLNRGRSYELKGTFLVQQLLARVGDSRWYIGPRYTYFNSDTRFTGEAASELNTADQQRRIGKLGLVVDYDNRDNMFYPTKGSYAELEAQFARGWLGSSQSFETYRARGYTWIPLNPKWNLGVRADGQTTSGAVPFYAQPSIDLRGVSRGRYQDKTALATELELRWNVTPRWSLLGFTGLGKAYGRWHSFNEASTVVSVGTGFRYLIARKMGLSVGIDVAHSKDQNAFYIQVGSAWR